MLTMVIMYVLVGLSLVLMFGHLFTGSFWAGVLCLIAAFYCAVRLGKAYRKKQESYSRYEQEK